MDSSHRMIGQACEHVSEPGVRINVVELGGLDERVAAARRPPSSEPAKVQLRHNVPADLDVYVVMDDYGTHKTKLIRHWFANRPALARALHADISVMDQPSRTLLRAID